MMQRLNRSGGCGSEFERFADETLALVCRTMGADWASFYRIEDDLRPFGFRSYQIPPEFGAAYQRDGMENVDPLHPMRLIPRKRRFITMLDARVYNPERYRAFASFLHSFGANEAAEMIFRFENRPVAGVSLVWADKRPERRATLNLGLSLHSYIEFNLAAVYGNVSSVGDGSDAAERCGCAFTGREIAVVDLVCRGLTNREIARDLAIGVSTVKTHLIHIFAKASVETRTQLISRVLGRVSGNAATADALAYAQ
jgi:DNA-binding CsgD family transcriptional regulator